MSIFKRKHKVEETPLNKLTAYAIAITDHLMTDMDEKYPQLHCKIEITNKPKYDEGSKFYGDLTLITEMIEEEQEELLNHFSLRNAFSQEVLHLPLKITLTLKSGVATIECTLGTAVELLQALTF